MKSLLPLRLSPLLFAIALVPCATNAQPAVAGWQKQALRLFPEADTDGDGVLSVNEALTYANQHPEVRQLIAKAQKGKGKGKGPRVTPPGQHSTPASRGLPPGPRVFVCAHSFMIFTGQLLPPLTEAAGIAYQDAGTQMIGGSRTLQHWEVPDAQNLAKQQLQAGAVDVLLVSPHMLLPDEGIDHFTQLGIQHQPNLRVLVQASWPAHDGQTTGFDNAQRDNATVEDLQALEAKYTASWLSDLEKQVAALNAQIGHPAVTIVPVARAVFALRQQVAEGTAPGVTRQSALFRDNLGHPQPVLAALVAYCHFAAVHRRSPVGLPIPAGLKEIPEAEKLNALLQKIAWDAVSHYAPSGVTPEAAPDSR